MSSSNRVRLMLPVLRLQMGNGFGPAGNGFIRLNMDNHAPGLEKAVEGLKRTLHLHPVESAQ